MMNHLRFLLGVLLLGLLFAGPAAADDLTPLEQLTAPERAALEQHVPGWADLPDAMKQRYAKGVLRARTLTPEQRTLLERRMRELQERRELGAGPRRGPGRHRSPRDFEAQGHLMKLIGAELWKSLSKESRANIDRVLGKHGRRDVNERFYRLVYLGLAKAKVAAGEYDTFRITESTPEPFKRKILQLRALATKGDGRAKLGLAHITVGSEIRAIVLPLVKDGRIDEDGLRREVQAFVETHADLLAKAKAQMEEAAADPEKLEAFVRPHGRRGPMGDRGQLLRDLAELKKAGAELQQALEDLGPAIQDPALRRKVDRVRKALKRLAKYDRAWAGGRGGMRRPPGPPGSRGGRRGPPDDK